MLQRRDAVAPVACLLLLACELCTPGPAAAQVFAEELRIEGAWPEITLSGGGGIGLGNSLDSNVFGKLRLGALYAYEPWIFTAGAIGELGALAERGVGAEIEVHHFGGLWAQVGGSRVLRGQWMGHLTFGSRCSGSSGSTGSARTAMHCCFCCARRSAVVVPARGRRRARAPAARRRARRVVVERERCASRSRTARQPRCARYGPERCELAELASVSAMSRSPAPGRRASLRSARRACSRPRASGRTKSEALRPRRFSKQTRRACAAALRARGCRTARAPSSAKLCAARACAARSRPAPRRPRAARRAGASEQHPASRAPAKNACVSSSVRERAVAQASLSC